MPMLLQKRRGVCEREVRRATIQSEPGKRIDEREYVTFGAPGPAGGMKTKRVKHRVTWSPGATKVGLPHTTLYYGYSRDGKHLNGMHGKYRVATEKGQAAVAAAATAVTAARVAYREALDRAWKNATKIDDANAADVFGQFETAEVV